MECSSSAASPSRYSSSSRLSKTSSRGEPVFAPSSGGVGSIALLHGSEWTRNPSDLAWAAYAMTDHDPGVAGADAVQCEPARSPTGRWPGRPVRDGRCERQARARLDRQLHPSMELQ